MRLVDPRHLTEVDALFTRAMDERTSSWWLDENGEWTRHHQDAEGKPLDDMQNRLMQQIGQRKRPVSRR